MAEGRMLKKNISRSEKLARLKTHKPRVLYFMMLPHLDVEGRLEANPKLIRGQIVPLLNYSVSGVQTCLDELNEVGLIQLYDGNGKKCLAYTKFHDHQNLRKDREAASEHPTPPQLPECAGITPIEVKLSKVNLKEEKVKHLNFVFLTSEEHKKLLERYGDNNTRKLIDSLNRYIGSTGKKYKSHYFTLLNFAKRDEMPELKTPEQKATQDKQAREKYQEKVRKEDGDYYRSLSDEKLRECYKAKSLTHRRWLIREILTERGGKT